MPNKEGNSNSQQNGTPAGKEPYAGLLKRQSDQALLLTARTPIYAGKPSLLSYIQQKSRHVGETGSQLARSVIGRDYLTSAVLRATRLPLLSRVFDYVSRKTAFITPLLQQVLDLPWFRRKQKQQHGISRATGAAADGIKNDTISLRTDELHPDTVLRTLTGAEGQPGDEMDETYQPAAEETYPMVISDLPLPLAARMEIPDTTSEPPRYPLVTSRRFDIRQGINRMTNESSRDFTVSHVEPPQVPPDTTSEPFHHTRTSRPLDAGQIIDRMVTQHSRGFIGSHIEPPRIPLSGSYRSREIVKADREQFEGAPESPTEVDRKPQSTPPPRKWSQVLMTLARRVFRQQEPTTVHPDIAAEDIGEVHEAAIRRTEYARAVEPEIESGSAVAQQPTLPFPADTSGIVKSHEAAERTGESFEAAVPDVRVVRKPASPGQPDILESKTPAHVSPARSRPSIFRSILDLPLRIPGPSIMRKAAKYIGQLVSDRSSFKTSTADEGTKKVPGRVPPERMPQASRPRHEPVVSPALEPATPEDSVVYRTEDISGVKQGPDTVSTAFTEDKTVYQAEGMTDVIQGSDTFHPLALEYGRIEPDYVYRRMIKPRLRGESPFVTIPPVKRLSVPGDIHRTMASLSQRLFRSKARKPLPESIEDYGFQRDREYMPSASGYEYAREPALEMPVPSLIQPEAEYDAAYSQDFLVSRYSILPELTYTRSQNLPEPEPAQVNRVIQEPSRSIASESQEEESAVEATAPDIDVIARDVYSRLKRRLINERERSLGVV